MKKNSFILTFFSIISVFSQDVMSKQTVKLMGSRFDVTMVAENEEEANNYIKEAIDEITRIEKLISSWDVNSQTTKINKNAGIKPIKVEKELFNLIERSIQISKITDGAFDITFASIDKVWKFDGSMKEMPSKELIAKSITKVGYKNIILHEENSTVFLEIEGMKIGFGALGKGYAADKVKDIMMQKGVKAGIINASGDLTTWGKQPDNKDWMVGITNPLNKDKVFSWFPVKNAAVATSGNYEKYVEFNGKRYTHIIDPRTGYPAYGIVSVTVFSESGELCDALATSVFIMGIESGLDMVNQLKGVECIIVDESNKVHNSNNIELNIE